MKRMNSHKNVVLFLGVCNNPLCIVTEFCEKGSLQAVLLDTSVILSQEVKNKIILDIASGMYHLSSEHIIHKDLAARNVLLTTDFTAKVADFGLSRFTSAAEFQATGEVIYISKSDFGPLKWMAPESLESRIFSTKSDVWSFGITVLEILTRQPPYQGISIVLFANCYQTHHSNITSYIPTDIPSNLDKILRSCFIQDPNSRITFGEICNVLKTN